MRTLKNFIVKKKTKNEKKISTSFHVTKRTPIKISANTSSYISLSFNTLQLIKSLVYLRDR